MILCLSFQKSPPTVSACVMMTAMTVGEQIAFSIVCGTSAMHLASWKMTCCLDYWQTAPFQSPLVCVGYYSVADAVVAAAVAFAAVAASLSYYSAASSGSCYSASSGSCYFASSWSYHS